MTTGAIPLLHEDGQSLDWPSATYSVNVVVTDRSAEIEHVLEGAPQLDALVAAGDLQWAVELRCPKTLHSSVSYSSSPMCKLEWSSDLVDGDIYILPGLVSVRAFSLSGEGLSHIWNNQPVEVPIGSWLVRGDVRSVNSLAASLLKFYPDSVLEPGEMRAVRDTGSGDIHFNIYVAAEMLDTCLSDRNVQVAALIAAFAQFPQIDKPDSEGDDEGGSPQYPRMQRIYDRLRDLEIPTWLDDGEDFDPARAATAVERFEARLAPDEDDD